MSVQRLESGDMVSAVKSGQEMETGQGSIDAGDSRG